MWSAQSVKIRLVGSFPAQSSATRHWKFFILYPVTQYIPLFAMKLWNALQSLAMGSGSRDVNQHPRQDWNVLTQLGSLAFCLCQWPEKTLPGLPTGSSGLTGDTWRRHGSQSKPRSAQLPAKPSLAQPTYRLISKRSASRGGHWDFAAVNWSITGDCATLGNPFTT